MLTHIDRNKNIELDRVPSYKRKITYWLSAVEGEATENLIKSTLVSKRRIYFLFIYLQYAGKSEL